MLKPILSVKVINLMKVRWNPNKRAHSQWVVRGLTRGGGDGMTSLLVSNQLSLKPSKVAIIVFCRSVLLSHFFSVLLSLEGYDNPQTFLVFKLCEFHGKAEYNYSTCSLHLHSDILLQEFCSGQLEVGEQHVRFFFPAKLLHCVI